MMGARFHVFWILVTLFCSLSALAHGAAIDAELRAAIDSGADSVPVIVVFHDTLDLSILDDASRSSRGDKIRALQENARRSRSGFLRDFGIRDDVRKFWLVNAIALELPAHLVEIVAERDDVARVEFDHVVHLPAVQQSDESPRGEWTYGLERIRIPELREKFGLLGDGVVVGVIDTGIDGNHPDLAGKVIGFKDFVQGRDEPYDDQGHGTHCAGTIAGGASSGTAIGVAPNVELVVAKAFSATGSAQSSWLLGSMEYMAAPNGDPDCPNVPTVVNNSWGGGPGTTTYLEATRRWVSLGIFPAFAAGNSGPWAGTVGTPGGFLESFAVGATTSSDDIARFSSRGPVTWNGVQHVKPDVSAPGQDVVSARPGGGYVSLSGTSMACPHVAGVVALIHQASPGVGIDEVRRILEETSLDLGEPGKNNTFGSGRIDAFEALSIAVSGGRIVGRLIDADTGASLGGTVSILERGMTLTVDSSTGEFLATLPEGEYSIGAESFGYEPSETLSVSVVADEEVNVELALHRSSWGALAGRVVSAGSGAPVSASVAVQHPAIAPVTTDSDGSFFCPLPPGSYDLVVCAFGYAVLKLEDLSVSSDEETVIEARLIDLPPVLLVDDDRGKSYEVFYIEALEALGYEFDIVDMEEAGSLGDEVLGYDVIIWFTGDDYQSTLTAADRELLTRYVDSGGRLLASGQDIAYDIRTSDFLRDVAKTSYEKDDAGSRSVSGQGLSFSIAGGDGASNQRYPDGLRPLAGGESFFSYDGVDYDAAIMARHDTGACLLLGFGVEGVSSAADRAAVIDAALEGLRPSVDERVARLLTLSRPEHRARWIELIAPLIHDLDEGRIELLRDLVEDSRFPEAPRRKLRRLLEAPRY